MFYIESKGYLSNYQSGFRRGRNTMDPVLCLEHEVRRAQINKESVVAVFFDIEKAYDTLWREGLLIKIKQMGIGGRMFKWIKNFLMGRQIQVRIGKILSEKFPVVNGTPQGSIVSPLLFSIMINDVFNGIKDGMGFSLFADDGAVWYRGKNLEFIVKKLQVAIDGVVEWSYRWGFKFSVDKTKTMFFTRKKVREDLKLELYSQGLERVRKFKFLGVWFDERLTWGVHIQSIMDKCKKVLNIMRCLVGSEWGADRKSMKAIYVGLIRSVLDYGCVAYTSAAKTTLLKLNSIQNQALRLCTGAFRTTPIAALQVEMGEMPIELRREQLALNYWANLRGQKDDHPTLDILKPCWEKEKKDTKSFGWMMIKKPVELKLVQFEISRRVPFPAIPPWILPEASVDLTLLERKNKDKSFILNSHAAQDYIDHYYNFVKLYTDASKDTADRVGVAFIVPEFRVAVKKRVSDGLSVYTGEMLAILLAVQWVEEHRPLFSVICSDSSSSLTSLRCSHSDSRPDVLIEIQQSLYRINMMGLTIRFLWIPAHCGIRGNEEVDTVAKEATISTSVQLVIPFCRKEVKSMIRQEMMKEWQKQWEKERRGRWLYKIQRRVGDMRNTGRSRREEVIVSRLRFGHTGLNNTLFIIGKHDTGTCVYCGEEETVGHVVLHCRKYQAERRKMIRILSRMKVKLDLIDLLRQNSKSDCFQVLFQFLKEIRVFGRI
uniref:Reverse transcriptase domain-containing protein n=1 Tax=Nothobranchius pienaari TaxID=704102 RepID=A0A1A8L2C0_9TELE